MNLEMMEEKQNVFSEVRLSNDYAFAYNILTLIIPYLNFKDLIACSQVCTIWRVIIREASFWSTHVMRTCWNHVKVLSKCPEILFRKIELQYIYGYEIIKYPNFLTTAVNLEELELTQCYFKFSEKLLSVLKNLKVLNVSQTAERDEKENLFTPEFFKHLTNLERLSIKSTLKIPWHAAEIMTNLKHLFIDANYNEEFFNCDFKFFDELESFGIGFTHFHETPELISEYSLKLSGWVEQMKRLKKLQLYGLENDCLMLATVCKTVCKLQQLEVLELGVSNTSNNYSYFLPMCHNIKVLYVTFYIPYDRWLNIEKIAAQNTILCATIKKLKNTLKKFTWIFDHSYMMENERVLSINNDQRRSRITAIWNNISDFEPKDFNLSEIYSITNQHTVSELFLNDLELMMAKELPYTNVRVISGRLNECELCPKSTERIGKRRKYDDEYGSNDCFGMRRASSSSSSSSSRSPFRSLWTVDIDLP